MTKKQRLELTWIGKDERPKLEPRILIEDPHLSYCGKEPKPAGVFDNMLIKGDNLLALKALEQEYAGKIKCIYIDPPYNTGQAFPEYDDSGVEHSVWLSLIRERLELLRTLLASDGMFFMQLNDEEAAYAKVLCDEIFGRANFLNQISVKTKLGAGASGGGEDKKLKKNIEYILAYAKDAALFQKFNEFYDEEDLFELIDDMEASGQSWKYTSVFMGEGENIDERRVKDGEGNDIIVRKYRGLRRATIKSLSRERGVPPEEVYVSEFERIFSDTNAQTSIRTRIIDEFKSLNDGEYLTATYTPRSGREKGREATHYYVSETIRRVIWLKDTAIKKGNRLLKRERVGTLWDGIRWNNVNKEGGVEFGGGKKPEELIRRILELATNEGDIVLDSFGGSGTTGAVAHKMKRRWIMVELGEHADTLIVPRMKSVIDAGDRNGVTEAANWQGGGGFRYYILAPSLLEKDKYDNWVISKKYDANMLAAAVCKLMGFTYEPSRDEREYWRHGHSTETDFIYVTTQSLTYDALKRLSEDVGRKRTLLVCCKAYNAKDDAFDNITLRKIPQVVLKKCEWGRDDYSLKIAKVTPPDEVPVAVVETQPEATPPAAAAKRMRKSRKKPDDEATLDMFPKRVGA